MTDRTAGEILGGQYSWRAEAQELAARIHPGYSAELASEPRENDESGFRERAKRTIGDMQACGMAILDRLVQDGIVDEKTLRAYLEKQGEDE